MTTVYKGYLIRQNTITGQIWIEKGGFFIAYAGSINAAKAMIDLLI